MFDRKNNKRNRNKINNNENGSSNNNEKSYNNKRKYNMMTNNNNNGNIECTQIDNNNGGGTAAANCYTNENFVHEQNNVVYTQNNIECNNNTQYDDTTTPATPAATAKNTNEILNDDQSILYHSTIAYNQQDQGSSTTTTMDTGNVSVNGGALTINTNLHDNNSSGFSECSNSSESSTTDVRYQTDIMHTPLQQNNIYSTAYAVQAESTGQVMDYDTNIEYADCAQNQMIHHHQHHHLTQNTTPYYIWQTANTTDAQSCHEYAIQQSPAHQTPFYPATTYTAVPCIYTDSPYQNLIQPTQTYSPVSNTTISSIATANLSSSPNVYAHYQTQQHYLTASPNPAAHLAAHINSPTPTQVPMVAVSTTPYASYATANPAISYTPQIQTLLPITNMTPSPVPSSVLSSPYLMSPKSDTDRVRYRNTTNNHNNYNYNSNTFPKYSKKLSYNRQQQQQQQQQQITVDENNNIITKPNNNNQNTIPIANNNITSTPNTTNININSPSGDYKHMNNKHKSNYYHNNNYVYQQQQQQLLNEQTYSQSPQSSQSSQSSVSPSMLDSENSNCSSSSQETAQLSQSSNKSSQQYNNNDDGNNKHQRHYQQQHQQQQQRQHGYMVKNQNTEISEEGDDSQLACVVCRGKRMCFCYFLKVGYSKFPSYIDYVDHQYKKFRKDIIKTTKKVF